MSTGFRTDASAGKIPRKRAWVSGANSTTSNPRDSQASAMMIPGPPALVTMATRFPVGNRKIFEGHGHVEELFDGFGSEYSALGQESVDGQVCSGQGSGMG